MYNVIRIYGIYDICLVRSIDRPISRQNYNNLIMPPEISTGHTDIAAMIQRSAWNSRISTIHAQFQ